MRQITNEEIATILGALRCFQKDREQFVTMGGLAAEKFREKSEHFEEFAPLTDAAIDALCEDLNAKDTFIGDAGDSLHAGLLEIVLDLGRQDIYTDAPEYSERVDKLRSALDELASRLDPARGDEYRRQIEKERAEYQRERRRYELLQAAAVLKPHVLILPGSHHTRQNWWEQSVNDAEKILGEIERREKK